MTTTTGADLPQVGFTVSVDTEEDNWLPTRHNIRTSNIDQLPRLDQLFQSLGIRPTYLVTYQVAVNAQAASVLRAVHARGEAEIGAHLHPWNTPPFFGMEDELSMLLTYPETVQAQKISKLLEAIETNLGVRTSCFRAGRFGFGSSTANALISNGMFVDSSVTPLLTWEAYDNGPNFLQAPLSVYRFNEGAVLEPAPEDGGLVEVPLTIGYTRFRPSDWQRLNRVFEAGIVRRFRLRGIASRLGLCRRVILSPETSEVGEMVETTRRLVDSGARHLHMFLHSNSMAPGLTPFAKTESDVTSILNRIEEYLSRVTRFAALKYYTISEAAHRFTAQQSELRQRGAHFVMSLLGVGGSCGLV